MSRTSSHSGSPSTDQTDHYQVRKTSNFGHHAETQGVINNIGSQTIHLYPSNTLGEELRQSLSTRTNSIARSESDPPWSAESQRFQRASSSDVQDGAESKRTVDKPLDILFLQDTTGSQGPYIKAAKQAIRGICDTISAAADVSKDQIRFGLIAFRDHPPQDSTYVTKPFGFTSDVGRMQRNLSSLVASGGGDGPEAQTAALAAALDSEWAEDAIKMVVLITDSPPHGLGEERDGFSESPDQNDPIEIARQMSEKGIILIVIACEPSLSCWKHAVDFYTALAKITSGHLLPLLMADKIGDFIVATALEAIATEELVSEFEQAVIQDVYESDAPVGDIVSHLQEQIQSKGIQTSKLVTEDVYMSNPTTESNVATWLLSENVKMGRANVASVIEPRIEAKHAVNNAAPQILQGPFSFDQAHRVFIQSVTRNSKVTANEMCSKESTGKYSRRLSSRLHGIFQKSDAHKHSQPDPVTDMLVGEAGTHNPSQAVPNTDMLVGEAGTHNPSQAVPATDMLVSEAGTHNHSQAVPDTDMLVSEAGTHNHSQAVPATDIPVNKAGTHNSQAVLDADILVNANV